MFWSARWTAGPSTCGSVVAPHVAVAGKAGRHIAPGRGVAILEPHAPGAGRVGPEMVERVRQRRHAHVVGAEPQLGRGRQPVVLDRPVREPLALEALVVLV